MVEDAVVLYPDFVLLQTTLGRLLEGAGRPTEALAAWSAAHDINPYDPSVQQALAEGHRVAGNTVLADRHRRYADILAGRTPASDD